LVTRRPAATIAAFAVILACAWRPAAAGAQTRTGEVDATVGASTDDAQTASTQIRLFGATASDWRYYFEVSLGTITGDLSSDAFASAYPYDGRLRPIEAFGEKTLHPRGALLGMRAGKYRTPFGISGRSDHAYSGFLRAPSIRYGEYFALSNTFFEAGADVVVGRPALYAEASLGVPQDEGAMRRADGVDQVIRAQGYYRDLILGASYLRTRPSDPRPFAQGRMVFRGVDGRWMRSGVELRCEWIDGRPFDGVSTLGGYLDALVHYPQMGPVTAVARVERLDYDAGPFSEYLKRLTMGARVRAASWLVVQANVIREPAGLAKPRDQAIDLAVTFTRRF